MYSTAYALNHIAWQSLGNLRRHRGRIGRHSPEGRNAVTRYDATRQHPMDPSEAPTDQKVGGSNPSERAGRSRW
jgi:hypothetical protein